MENIRRRLQRLEDKLDLSERHVNREVVSEETRHVIQAILELRREGAWEPYDVESWDWMTRQHLEEHLRDLLLGKGVGRGLAENMGAQIAGSVIEKHAKARRRSADD